MSQSSTDDCPHLQCPWQPGPLQGHSSTVARSGWEGQWLAPPGGALHLRLWLKGAVSTCRLKGESQSSHVIAISQPSPSAHSYQQGESSLLPRCGSLAELQCGVTETLMEASHSTQFPPWPGVFPLLPLVEAQASHTPWGISAVDFLNIQLDWPKSSIAFSP